MGDVREIDLEYQGYTLVGLWDLLMCERGQHKKQLTTLQAEKERLEGELGRLKPCKDALSELCHLKDIKDRNGKTDAYLHFQPLAWEKARKALDDYLSGEHPTQEPTNEN